jgi:alpha-galactosidase
MIKNSSIGLCFLENLKFKLVSVENETLLAEGCIALWEGEKNLLDGIPQAVEHYEPEAVQTALGQAQRWTTQGIFNNRDEKRIRQTINIDLFPQWPNALVIQCQFENVGNTPVRIDRLDCPSLVMMDMKNDQKASHKIWSFHGAAVKWGQDFAFPLPKIFECDNYLGHRDNGEGGGIPLVYFWNTQLGLALAHTEVHQKDWYLPVDCSDQDGIQVALQNRRKIKLMPGETVQGLSTLISLHHGDFFEPLSLYREILAVQGLKPPEPNSEDYEPAWCSWGYEFDILPSEVIGVLPAVMDLKMRWLTLDDRWFDCYGDWNPRSDTFPGGAAEMRQMVDAIHHAGAYAQIWWYPLAVEDGNGKWASHRYELANILLQHPDWLIINEDGSVARNNRGLAILDPALPEVQETIRTLTKRFIQEWDFDGHKLDNIYTVPPCYNPAHKHHRPEESVEALTTVYQIIFETTRSLKSHSVTQICPCGTPPNFTLLPYLDQAVTADPISSAQIRQRIKFYKALIGPRAAVFADHVELSDGSADFASEIGVGGIPSTKFVWPPDAIVRGRVKEWWGLTTERLDYMKTWLNIYRKVHISDGEYLNLYDLAFDKPEAHVIRKHGSLYYAFYTEKASQTYEGIIELRGLGPGPYQVKNYVTNQVLGNLTSSEANLMVQFQGALLLEVMPR